MIVVDCSAVLDALAGAAGTEALRDVLAAQELHAPMLLDVELVSALRGLTRAGRMSRTRRNCQDLWIGVSRDLLITSGLLG